MFDTLKSIFGEKGDVAYSHSQAKEVLSQLREELEAHSTLFREGKEESHASIIAIAIRIRELITQKALVLDHKEKVELTRAINRAKVRSFLSGTEKGLKVFRALDSIGEDIRRRL